jgi:hypothetical protein
MPGKQTSSSNSGGLQENPKPSADAVEDFHTNSDLDTRPEAQHHSLGPNSAQAAPGDHMHDGGSSSLLLAGVTLSGSRGGNVALVSVIAALAKLGATDNTTA